MPELARIERKSLLYRSGLGMWCINHVQGCSHGCRYPCHAYLIFERHGRIRDYAEWCQPVLVGNALELLDKELRRKRTRPTRVHLCLSTDPFMLNQPDVHALSLALMSRLNEAGVACSVLTKGLLPEELADTRYSAENVYGISLVSLDEDFRQQWEPGAAPYARRIASLRKLHERGCRTYVHMEPYPTPNLIEQDLLAIVEQVAFANRIFFGRWNYNQRVARYRDADAFYREQSALLQQFCSARAIQCETTI